MPPRNAFPATASPMQAPMAAPPSAMPNPSRAAAIPIPWSLINYLLLMFMFETLPGRAEILDGQQHEDESLNETDEKNIESLPDRQQHAADDRTGYESHNRKRKRPEADDVAEQPHRQRHRLGHFLYQVERNENDSSDQRQLEWLRKAPQETRQAKHSDAVPLDDHDHHDGHGQRLVQVRIGAVKDRHDAERQELDPVGDQDVQE